MKSLIQIAVCFSDVNNSTSKFSLNYFCTAKTIRGVLVVLSCDKRKIRSSLDTKRDILSIHGLLSTLDFKLLVSKCIINNAAYCYISDQKNTILTKYSDGTHLDEVFWFQN